MDLDGKARPTSFLAAGWGICASSAYAYLSRLRTRGLVTKTIERKIQRRAFWSLKARAGA